MPVLRCEIPQTNRHTSLRNVVYGGGPATYDAGGSLVAMASLTDAN